MSLSETSTGQLIYGISAGVAAIIISSGSEMLGLGSKSRLIAMFVIAISALVFFYWPYIGKAWMRIFVICVIIISVLIAAIVPGDKVQMNSFAFYPLGLGLYIILALGLEVIGRYFEHHPL